MNNKIQLNETWLKASIIGTVWASSEIVLGSFLHNLQVPFSGSILTSIGIIILISASYVWKENGLFWRAGLICTLMKTMSPSAVIFGPMIAIFTESVLLEISVRTLGRNYFGYIIGSILAVSWSFFQKIFNFLIFYGFNIVKLYKNLMKFTEKQLNLQFNTLWIPILILLSVYVLFGLISAIIGVKTGKKLVSQPIKYEPQNYNNLEFLNKSNIKNEFKYSITWLVVNAFLIAAAIVLISLADWKIWTIAVIAIVTLWIIKYKRALRQLLKPKFWILFVVITMLTAFVFTKLQSKSILEAVLIGVEMNFRAMVLILGFSVLGTELYNPKIRNYFSKTYFKQLPLALELSAESLPLVIANIPDFKTIIKNPVLVISQLVAYSEYRFMQLKNEQNFTQKIFIITGKMDVGKTTFVKKVIENLKSKNIKVGGIYTQKVKENNERIGYDLVAVQTNKSEIFLRIEGNENLDKIGIFSIFPKALALGTESLKPENNKENQVVIIDEIGKLELENRAWAKGLDELIQFNKSHLLLVVREDITEKIIEKWNFQNYFVFNLNENQSQNIEKKIMETFN
jgi:nucleoside-triphosphatase THEP1